ncbi:hypothetical protein [Streptomyces sp. enrichment culture]|uniref:hypothetical protein n=1 Tax=Streptomyces sp. enrichment culture TaxID=1795815 RepID=UPI003F5546A9
MAAPHGTNTTGPRTSTVNAKSTGPKFFHLHGRRYGECPCGMEVSLTELDNLRRHKPPQE